MTKKPVEIKIMSYSDSREFTCAFTSIELFLSGCMCMYINPLEKITGEKTLYFRYF